MYRPLILDNLTTCVCVCFFCLEKSLRGNVMVLVCFFYIYLQPRYNMVARHGGAVAQLTAQLTDASITEKT